MIIPWADQETQPTFNQMFWVISKAKAILEALELKYHNHLRAPYLIGEKHCRFTKRYGRWSIVDDGDYDGEMRILEQSFETLEEAQEALHQAGGHIEALAPPVLEVVTLMEETPNQV